MLKQFLLDTLGWLTAIALLAVVYVGMAYLSCHAQGVCG